MNPNLKDAVEIFEKLGWLKVNSENVLKLPLGTAEEQKLALKGLSTGAWKRNGNMQNQWKDIYYTFPENMYPLENTRKLILYALRLGITIKRLLQLMEQFGYYDDKLIKVISSRGEKFFLEFVNSACIASTRWDGGPTRFGGMVVKCVLYYNVPIPENLEYLLDWSYHVRHTIEDTPQAHQFPKLQLADLEATFDNHVQLCIKLGMKDAKNFPEVVTYGIEKNLLNRQLVLEIAMNGLDTSVRPGDRKKWYQVLEAIEITNEELCQRLSALNPILASGDNYLINELAPRLIEHVAQGDLTEILLSAFATTTKKGKLLVLKSALKRDKPIDADTLAPWLNIYLLDKDNGVSKTAQVLMEKWHIIVEAANDKEEVNSDVWQVTPNIWVLPDFELGEVTTEALTDLASLIMRRKGEEVLGGDLDTERFLAMAISLAYEDSAAAKLALSGMRASWGILNVIKEWTRDDLKPYSVDPHNWVRNPIDARNHSVLQKLSVIPCLLSTPSRLDLSITLADLVHRILQYKEAGVELLEADFLLALARLDVTTQTDELVAKIKTIRMRILLNQQSMIKGNVSKILLAYLDDPIIEENIVKAKKNREIDKVKLPKCLDEFPNRFSGYYYRQEVNVLTLPHFQTVGFEFLRWNQGYMDHEKGRNLLQMAHRKKPLPANAVINFLATFRSDTTEEYWEALALAWQRGLICPHVADVTLMDGKDEKLISLVALASAFELIIEEGLLSVIWPILDDIVKLSATLPKIVTGTTEIVELMAKYLPTVVNAVDEKKAEAVELVLPGLRLLSEKKGKSRGVVIAQEMVAQLPTIEAQETVEPMEASMNQPTFDEAWVSYKTSELIDDGVSVVVEASGVSGVHKGEYIFNLFLPQQPAFKYQIHKGWTYDLEQEGHAAAQQVDHDTVGYQRAMFNELGYLRWCPTKEYLVFEENREWRKESGHKQHVYPLSLLTVILGLLAQGEGFYARRLLEELTKRGHLTAIAVRAGTKKLIKSPEFNAGKLMRHLEKSSEFLSIFYPILMEAVNHAGELITNGEKMPKWTNRILDVTLLYKDYLVEAKIRGVIGASEFTWDGLAQIAMMKGKSVAKEKAQQLIRVFDGS